MSEKIGSNAAREIDKMVERVARKAGYTGTGEMGYRDLLQAKLEQKREKLRRKADRYRRKLSLKPRNTDFAEEIRTYLTDGLRDLMAEGHTEEEAIKMTLEKFDEAELAHGFEAFVSEFEGFGMEEWMKDWHRHGGEAVGLFYAGFLFLGVAAGGLFGYIFGHSWISTGIGLAVGVVTGLGLGLLSNGLISLGTGREKA